MPVLIAVVLTWFARYLILKVLAVVGVAVGSYAIIQTFFDKYVNAGLAQIGGMPSDLMGLVGIAHIDHAISIVLGAMSVRAFITAAKTLLAKM